jgi:hypothetical protein
LSGLLNQVRLGQIIKEIKNRPPPNCGTLEVLGDEIMDLFYLILLGQGGIEIKSSKTQKTVNLFLVCFG